jgi:hypothetical protein
MLKYEFLLDRIYKMDLTCDTGASFASRFVPSSLPAHWPTKERAENLRLRRVWSQLSDK